VCPAHFHCPPKVSARINAHIPRLPLFLTRSLSRSLPRARTRSLPFSLRLLRARSLSRAVLLSFVRPLTLRVRDVTSERLRDESATIAIAVAAPVHAISRVYDNMLVNCS